MTAVLGIDGGRVAGGLALVRGGRLLAVGCWSHGKWRLHGSGPNVDGVGTSALPHVSALASLEIVHEWDRIVCEAVAHFAGKGEQLELATAAGEAIGAAWALCEAPISRPKPDVWRRVYTGGDKIVARREDYKRLAVGWLYGREVPGAPWLVPHGMDVSWLPAGLPDHAAEAVGIAVWGAR